MGDTPGMPGGRTALEPGTLLRSACYWLLYLVGLSGAYLHWQTGNTGLAALCAVAVAAAVGGIVRGSRRG